MKCRLLARALLLAPIVCFVLVTKVAADAESFDFVQLCDTQLGRGGYEHDIETFDLAVAQINALKPDFVLVCGDLVHNGADPKAYADFRSINDKFEVPSRLAPGNHDVGARPNKKTLQRYRDAIGPDYYTFDHKGYTFVVVNTQLWKVEVPEESGKHHAWFENTLRDAQAAGKPVVVAGHFPPFLRSIDEKENGLNLPVDARRAIMDLCTQYGVVAFLAGHIHRNNVAEYEGIPIVASGTTSFNVGRDPMGFRVWRMGPPNPGPMSHEYVAVEGAVRPQDLNKKR